MILAAGLGTRLKPYTDVLAKPAIPFLNIPLLYYSVALLKSSLSIDEIIMNSHYKPEQIRSLASALKVRTHVTLEEGIEPLGSGGGVWFARKHLLAERDFVIANGDEVILPTRIDLMSSMLRSHQASGAMATLLVKRDPRVGSQFGGVWTSAAGEVFGFGKTPPAAPSGLEGLHYVGVMIMNGRAFKYFPEGESNLLYDAVMKGRAAGEKISVFIDDCRWFETGNIKDYLDATAQILKDLAANPDDAFLRLLVKEFASSSSLQNRNGTIVFADRRSAISPGADLSGFVVLADGVSVPDGCELHNVVVAKGVKLEAQSYENDLLVPDL